ncbi:uncharacterized protein OCT59_023361 [Rhizophagus irregularis]|uniref:uncharacterized protein n=1 Tax=Rhizophagus irregularis TaxID=588596 RepID=UPI0019E1C57D|nr:hypothetical protein OCT59_023361 [Rhizophagus irregularis]GET58209.1 hypothetical protein RIR_jg39198.t1 [Rhizophagus irregularis DAOM 181602=DAOM 197198]
MNYGNLDVRRRNDQDLKKRTNYIKKSGRETKLNDQDSKKRTNYGNLDNELWKPGRETKERSGFKRTNCGNLNVRRRNDQNLKERTMETWM